MLIQEAKRRIVPRKVLNGVGKYTLLIVFTVILMFPFAALLLTSFKTTHQILTEPLKFFPTTWEFGNYIKAFERLNFLRITFNSLHIALFSVVGTVFSSAVVAYAFVKFKTKESGIIFSIMMLSIMIPGQIVQIPMYELYRSFNWINTFLPFWIPPFLGGGIANVFLIMQFLRNIPSSLFESAEVDGAKPLRVFVQIAIPLAKPILFTVAIFSFIGCWNDFFTPLLLLTKENNYTLALGLYHLFDFNENGTKPWNLISAANVVTMLPIILLYFFAQRYFVEGITLGGVKG